ncbi:MAG TPA: cytochrome c [Gammaproteobacteria bacterium]
MTKHKHRIFCLVTGLLFSMKAVTASEPLELRKIMNELGQNMQTITEGISREEWKLVEKTALSIAEHPQPPLSEKIRILNFVGTNMTKFKAYDGETQKQALAVEKAARAEDGAGVIIAFQKLQMSCFNCHNEFRKPFIGHFYGAKYVDK